MPDLARALHLARALRGLLLPSVAVGHADPLGIHADSGPAGATPARRAEFAAGRAAAAMAMRALGLPDAAIPMGQDRAPVWSQGITGSITHTRSACLAALARTPAIIGIDMEPETAVDPALWDEICLPAEHDLVTASPDPARMATLIFCAKEAVYKAQYPLTCKLFGFDRLLILPGPDDFTATFRATTGAIPAGTVWTGRHVLAAGHRITAVHRVP